MAWHEAAEAEVLGEEEAMSVTLAGRQIALCRSGGGLYALDNVCTHQYALLSDGFVEDGCIECPLHQSRFDLKTGAALGPPATEPVRVYPVRTEGDKVFVEIKD